MTSPTIPPRHLSAAEAAAIVAEGAGLRAKIAEAERMRGALVHAKNALALARAYVITAAHDTSLSPAGRDEAAARLRAMAGSYAEITALLGGSDA